MYAGRLLLIALLGAAPAIAGAWTFTDVTAAAGLTYQHGYAQLGQGGLVTAWIAGGVAAGDYDGDGWVDLYVVRGDIGPNLLFHNGGDGTFEEVGARSGVALRGNGSGPTFADFDGDGRLDLIVPGIGRYLGTRQPTPLTLFRNRGDGTFEDVTARSGIVIDDRDTYSAAFGDYDRDGFLDLFLTHWGDNVFGATSSKQLWHNNGDGTFSDVSIAAGIAAAYTVAGAIGDLSFTPNFADIDDDGWPDILVAGDFGTSRVFLNNCDGTFRNVTDRAVITDENGMGGAVGDYDNDGHLDWFVSSIWDPNGDPGTNAWHASGNRLYRNTGNGVFEDATDHAGVRQGWWGWGSSFADLDNDGHLDLFHVNGWNNPEGPFEEDPARCFISNGDGTFTERSAALGLADAGEGRGVVAFDYDGDGDLDLFVANNQQAPRLYRNDGCDTGHFLSVKLRGRAPNTEAIGARVYVTAGGQTQMRELRAGSNFESQDPADAHFGLGTATSVDEIRIVWPDGTPTVLGGQAADAFLVVDAAGEVLATAPAPCTLGTTSTTTTASTTTTTTATMIPDVFDVQLSSLGRGRAVVVTCTRRDVTAGRRAWCEAQGLAPRPDYVDVLATVMRPVKQPFRGGSARLTLRLNARGKRYLRARGVLRVQIEVVMRDSAGHTARRDEVALVPRRR